MFPRCQFCNEPIVFVPIFGWQHMTLEGFDHDAEELDR